ncbi:double-strand-break repair protein rad21-like protein 1 isoform X2 [Oryzias melastigma]|uniref:double-strand-break repair protein rad21-like protein 1 isoform X2 n=1 Tax=Oryzias melastigma TaxID=30732 RepID=UPI000CF80F00|nr:double-strand-break repair protein rad21-like protein 1 isoform X2 [Oryzias melastigma]
MFYTQLFTSKRGSLAKIWLAAHWERKLTKPHVFECNLEVTVREILSPKMKVGLRTSGHLLIGLVRIYSRKAKYLLADCTIALGKISTSFRPDQTDMCVGRLEARVKEITLTEDFTAFDVELPHPCDIDIVEDFSLNQCRSEEITLKEDFGNNFLTLADIGIGSDSMVPSNTVLDRSFEAFAHHDDAFGDEDKGLDLLDFLGMSSEPTDLMEELTQQTPESPSPNELQNQSAAPEGDLMEAETPTPNQNTPLADMEAETPTPHQSTLLADMEVAFALEPVAMTPNSEKRVGKRKRKLLVDQAKDLSNNFIRKQLSDFSDLVAALDMAPPTVQLMYWKESGSVNKLFSQPCSAVLGPQINQLFVKNSLNQSYSKPRGEVEEMRQDGEKIQSDRSSLSSDNSVRDSWINPDNTRTELTPLHDTNHNQEGHSELLHDRNLSELTHLDLPSEDSMFVHPSHVEQESQSTSLLSQSMLSSQDFEEKRITKRAQKLLYALKSQSGSDPTFSLRSLCEGSTRAQAAAIFFSFLVLRKQHALHLHQSAPYKDVLATPGPTYHSL